ncbi:hypothetical protein [Streptomyces sp. NPDC002164]
MNDNPQPHLRAQEPPVPDESDLAAADAMIHAAWGHPVEKLTHFLREGKV